MNPRESVPDIAVAGPGPAVEPPIDRELPAERSRRPVREPLCPRCGYDQSGAVATWAEACPLRGTCPECGYEFAWREVFNPDEKRLPKFIEHCRRRAIPLAAVRTLLWALIPGRFWNRVKLHHEVRKRRWVVWLLLVLVGWHGVNVLIEAGANWSADLAYHQRFVVSRAYGFAQPGHDGILRGSARVPPAPGPEWDDLRGPLFWPFHDEEDGWAALLSSRRGSFGWISEIDSDAVVLLIGLGVTLFMPLVMLVMPATRRRYKVRWAHVGRASVFGLSWLAIPLAIRTWNGVCQVLSTTHLGGGMAAHLPGTIVMTGASSFSMTLLAGYLVWWWWRAFGKGWGIPNALGHALALVAISLCAWLVILSTFDVLLDARIDTLRPDVNGSYFPRLHNPWRR